LPGTTTIDHPCRFQREQEEIYDLFPRLRSHRDRGGRSFQGGNKLPPKTAHFLHPHEAALPAIARLIFASGHGAILSQFRPAKNRAAPAPCSLTGGTPIRA
jgi:hypothetical protein